MLKVGQHVIAPGHRAFLTAEIGGNHGGDFALAARLVEAAAAAGAAGVKFQAYRAADFLSPLSPYYDELAAEELSFDDLARLISLAHGLNLAAGITVFDSAGLELAREADADFIKISSGDITNFPLLEQAADAGLPLMFSTGAADEAEVLAALRHLEAASGRLVALQCAALYPAPPDSAELAVMSGWLRAGLLAGYSDHTLGTDAARAALALGAAALEKHFTIDRALKAGDNAISALPDEFAELARWAELCVRLWGGAAKSVQPRERDVRPLIRRAAVAARDLAAGRVVSAADLALKRPAGPRPGLIAPTDLPKLLGRVLKTDLPRGASVTLADLEP